MIQQIRTAAVQLGCMCFLESKSLIDIDPENGSDNYCQSVISRISHSILELQYMDFTAKT